MRKVWNFLVWGFEDGPFWLTILLLLSALIFAFAWVFLVLVMFVEFGPLAGCVSLLGPPVAALTVAFEHWRLTVGRD